MINSSIKTQSFILSLLLIFNLSTGSALSLPEPIFIKVAEGLNQPVHFTHANDNSGLLYIVEQPGRIKILKDGIVIETLFLDITDKVLFGGERGLFSIAFPPNYPNKRYFYVNYSNVSGDTTISRFYLETNKNRADPQTEEIILTVKQPFANHNGGQLAFGPDGFLYIGLGDGGGTGNPTGSGQNGNTLLGKMLRIDVESGITPYSIPDTNPFLETPGFRSEIWASGLRNPWRFSFDRETSDLYIADVGQNQFEEINVQPANSLGGENYGWNILEGFHCFNNPTCNSNGLTAPILEYNHSQGDVSITGGFVYRGKEFPRMQGVYFFADFISGRVGSLQRVNNQWQSAVLSNTQFNISSFGEDSAGQIYLLDISGSIYRIEDTIKLSQLKFTELLPQYQSGDTLQLSIQQTDSNRSVSTDLWVALQAPKGDLLFFSSNLGQPLTVEPRPFIKQINSTVFEHRILNITIPENITKGVYTFYTLYNEVGADLSALPTTLRSNIAQIKTVVVD